MIIDNFLFKQCPVLIKGAGDLATGVAARLYHAGFPVVMTEIAAPTMVRRTVSFGSAIFEGGITVDGVTAVKCAPTEVESCLYQGEIPVLVDPAAQIAAVLKPVVLVDAIIAKRNTGTRITDAPLVIALGPGFTAGDDCHLVIETNRGHTLGRIIISGSALPDTGVPGSVTGKGSERVLRSPVAGRLNPAANIGDMVTGGQVLGEVAGEPVLAPFDGVLRGLIHPSVTVTPGYKIGDVDPRGVREHCFTISDKSFAIAGGVLQAILANPSVKQKIR